MYIVIGYHGLDNQCIAVRMANMMCVSLTKSDIFSLAFSLLGRPLVERVHNHNQPFSSFFEVAVLGSPRHLGEVWFTEDGSDFVGLGAPVADVIMEINLSNELFNLVLEDDAFFLGVADISMKSAIFIWVPLRAIFPHRIGSFVHARVFHGQEYILT